MINITLSTEDANTLLDQYKVEITIQRRNFQDYVCGEPSTREVAAANMRFYSARSTVLLDLLQNSPEHYEAAVLWAEHTAVIPGKVI